MPSGPRACLHERMLRVSRGWMPVSPNPREMNSTQWEPLWLSDLSYFILTQVTAVWDNPDLPVPQVRHRGHVAKKRGTFNRHPSSVSCCHDKTPPSSSNLRIKVNFSLSFQLAAHRFGRVKAGHKPASHTHSQEQRENACLLTGTQTMKWSCSQ